MESFHVESSSFIQNLKAFNISNARQLVSVYCRHVESLGSFQYFQCQATSVNVVMTNTKKEKVRNQTTYITKFRREGDRLKRRRKKKKEEEEEEAVASWRHPYFVVVFFLFSIFFFFKVQIQWEVGNHEKHSDHGSQNCEVRPWFARVPTFFPQRGS